MAMDMLVKLYDLAFSETDSQRLNAEGIRIHRALHIDREQVVRLRRYPVQQRLAQ